MAKLVVTKSNWKRGEVISFISFSRTAPMRKREKTVACWLITINTKLYNNIIYLVFSLSALLFFQVWGRYEVTRKTR